MTTYQHWIDGAHVAGESTRTSDVFDPATGRPTKQLTLATRGDVDTAVAAAQLLPGARAAVEAANARGGSMVISAKHAPNVQLHVDHLGLDVGEVVGDAWREQKGEVLRARAAAMYVGDHEHDMVAARLAGVIGVGVATGGTTADQLREAGADVVLASLSEFATALDPLP